MRMQYADFFSKSECINLLDFIETTGGMDPHNCTFEDERLKTKLYDRCKQLDIIAKFNIHDQFYVTITKKKETSSFQFSSKKIKFYKGEEIHYSFFIAIEPSIILMYKVPISLDMGEIYLADQFQSQIYYPLKGRLLCGYITNPLE